MAVPLDAVQRRNYIEARRVFDKWFDANQPGYAREDGWLRLVAALDTESKNRILAHGGGWDGGDRTNTAQRQVLATSDDLYRQATGMDPDGYGNNGGSVGPLQQIPSPVSKLRTVGGLDDGKPAPWDGWGSIVECMVIATCVPKFLDRLRVTTSNIYKNNKVVSSDVVADLLWVQQPAANEVEDNYGPGIKPRAQDIAGQFPRFVAVPVIEQTFIDHLLNRR